MTGTANAVLIDESGDQFTSGIGDYLYASGFTELVASSPGQIEDIVGANGGSDLAQTGSETNTISWGDVQDVLDGSLSTSNILVFGFAANQNGPLDVITIEIFDIDFDNDGTVDFSLGTDSIGVLDFHEGISKPEIRIAVDLGFDVFLQDPLDLLTISMTVTGDTNGFDTLFLSETFTAFPDPVIDPVPVPEPSTLALFGFGLAALGVMFRRRRRELPLAV